MMVIKNYHQAIRTVLYILMFKTWENPKSNKSNQFPKFYSYI